MLQARLKVVGGRHHGKIIPLGTKKFLIGREQDCHLRPNSELVSRHHCVLALDDFGVRLRDLGSTNGTFVNDQRVRGEIVLNPGDRVRVGKLDFELVVGDVLQPAADHAGDSAQNLPSAPVDPSTAETNSIANNGSDTSFEIPVPPSIEDTGSSILPNDPDTVAPGLGVPAASGDSTVVWTPPAAAGGYPQDPYAAMGMPYPQAAYQPPPYGYLPPGMGYQAPMGYPQMPMGYPGMYPGMGQMGMYPQMPTYPQSAMPAPAENPPIELPDDSAAAIPVVRLPDPKTTGAKSAAPPPPPQSTEGAAPGETQDAKKPEPPPGKPSERAADILKNYTQRRPV